MLIALLWFAFLFGGSATAAGVFIAWLLPIAAAGCAAFFLLRPSDRSGVLPALIGWIAGATATLALLHLIPLPAVIWTALPGRDLERAIVALIGGEERWLPLSLRPLDSLRSALHLLPPLAVLIGVTRIRRDQIRQLLLAMLAAIGLSVVIGGLQASSGGSAFAFYDTQHSGFPIGFFSNRNHQADAMLLGYLIACWFAGQISDARNRLGAWLGLTALLVALMVATGSRTGLALSLLAAAASLPLFVDLRSAWRNKGIALAIGGGVAAIAGLIALSAPGQLLAGRFADAAADHRPDYWRISQPLLADYWTTGAGFGSFPRLFMTVEPLGAVRRYYVNAAHNDYLQLAIEGGLPALLLLAAVWVALLLRAARLLRAGLNRSDDTRLAWLMLCFVVAMLLHSAVDYPLRTASIACLWTAAAAILFRLANSPDAPAARA